MIPAAWRRRAVAMLAMLVLAGCAGTPTSVPVYDRGDPASDPDTSGTVGEQVAAIALSMVGTPYRWGGSTPGGFDCSGLVYYAYSSVGKAVPRTARAQIQAARHIRDGIVRKGDLVYFDKLWKRGHIGIYVGDQRFVHAPSSGKHVRVDYLNYGYYASQGARIGRVKP